ncbi:MAG: hypothetical protein ACTSRC_21920 [Candidatus Helarchaeota archaeon]
MLRIYDITNKKGQQKRIITRNACQAVRLSGWKLDDVSIEYKGEWHAVARHKKLQEVFSPAKKHRSTVEKER